MWFVIGALAALLTLATGYWLGYIYGRNEGREGHRQAEMDMEAMQSTIQHHENTIAMQDTALDTYRGMTIVGDSIVESNTRWVSYNFPTGKGDC
jgi:hypothetical protein